MNSENYIQRCLDLASLGLGSVSPNPMVGCVIVKDNKIIGEGYHQKCGEPHAEVLALQSIKQNESAENSTVYVSLEPCAHHGKTPPCANALVEAKVSKVVVCNLDPFEEVNGRGISILKEAGIQVEYGILEKEGLSLNKRFFTCIEKKRPYIILKWAESEDGFIAPIESKGYWISSEESNLRVHMMRSQEDAFLVGKNTVLKDNPSLTTRLVKGKNPVRVVLDSDLELNAEHNVFNNASKTITLNKLQNFNGQPEGIKCDMTPADICSVLLKQNIQSAVIEGGKSVLDSFISQNLWDEAFRIIGNSKFGEGIDAPSISGISTSERVGTDVWHHYKNNPYA